ncbi:Chromosomal replication initiator, DnaA-like protein [Candidatus Koribacter versatilis Ellin345]|uniref:Chromosomal replication initiator, DnaA-like protein n=1 Tax=Koribacter versatilis (strain Ellin345) TaxID=204669 RepID=Q1IL72_KORVE|nr:helix-turn-helix domain-containing protein [Candidatus Koribacter versatilis]ABF42378.1 Chromosomal replication initiator, DnaA-like protein [Candidatus Koribacter versatilis Ellin345]
MNLELLKPHKMPPQPALTSSDLAAMRVMLSEMRTQIDRLHEISEEFIRMRRHNRGSQYEEREMKPRINRAGRVITLSAIAEEVAKEFEVPLEYFSTPRKFSRMALVRQVMWLLASHLTPYSLSEIARKSDVHHTTLCYGVRRIKERLVTDPQLARTVRTIKARLEGDVSTAPAGRIRFSDVVREVALDYGCTEADVMQPGNAQPGAKMRAIVTYIAHRLGIGSFPDIALYLVRSTGTAKTSVTRLEKSMAESAELRERVEAIERRLFARMQEAGDE